MWPILSGSKKAFEGSFAIWGAYENGKLVGLIRAVGGWSFDFVYSGSARSAGLSAAGGLVHPL